ncbi:Hemolysin E, partial [Pseudolycoriella hygida]
MTEASLIMTLHKASIDSLDEVMTLYNNRLDLLVPWKTLNDTGKELDRYRKDYSYESGELVNEIKHLITLQLLENYCQIFETRPSNAFEQSKSILIQVMETGILNMRGAQSKVNESSSFFINATGKLAGLCIRLEREFDSKSTYYLSKVEEMRNQAAGVAGGPFGLIIANVVADSTVEEKLIPMLNAKLNEVTNFFKRLKSFIDQADRDIRITIDKLREAIINVSDLRNTTNVKKSVVDVGAIDELGETVLTSVANLINQCDKYQINHGRRN